MSPNNNNDQPSDQPIDQPIDQLAELEQEVSPDFLRGIRNKIYRRTATGQVLSFSWNLPKIIFLELITLFGGLLRGDDSKVKS